MMEHDPLLNGELILFLFNFLFLLDYSHFLLSTGYKAEKTSGSNSYSHYFPYLILNLIDFRSLNVIKQSKNGDL